MKLIELKDVLKNRKVDIANERPITFFFVKDIEYLKNNQLSYLPIYGLSEVNDYCFEFLNMRDLSLFSFLTDDGVMQDDIVVL